ncbi:MAG: helix-turn-helix transcriptional regulator [Spirosomataceae bacterium]
MMKTITEQIRVSRLQKGLSQENMADLLGISTTAYGDIERGKTEMTLPRLYQIAEVLNENIGMLLGEDSVHQQELQRLELEKLKAEKEKLQIENQYLREKLVGKIILDLARDHAEAIQERQKIGF